MEENKEMQMDTPSAENAENAETGKKKFWDKFRDNLIVLYLLTFVLLFLGQLLGSLCEFVLLIGDTPALVTFILYFETIGAWIIFLIYMLAIKKNRPILQTLWTKAKGNNVKFLLIGTLIGFASNMFCILIAWLHKDIYLFRNNGKLLPCILIFLAVFVQSSSEEMICRGFLYQRLRMGYKHPAVAIIGNSLFFGCLHLMNQGVTVLSFINIVVVGISFSLLVYYYDSIWAAMMFHTAWNFSQSILFGLPNSGIVVPYSFLGLDASTATDSFAYNVGFGIEGTLVADAVLILIVVLQILIGEKQKKKAAAGVVEATK